MGKSEIKAARERAGYSVRVFSELAGCSPSTLQDIENGRKVPRVDTLRRIADALVCGPLRKVKNKKKRSSHTV